MHQFTFFQFQTDSVTRIWMSAETDTDIDTRAWMLLLLLLLLLLVLCVRLRQTEAVCVSGCWLCLGSHPAKAFQKAYLVFMLPNSCTSFWNFSFVLRTLVSMSPSWDQLCLWAWQPFASVSSSGALESCDSNLRPLWDCWIVMFKFLFEYYCEFRKVQIRAWAVGMKWI